MYGTEPEKMFWATLTNYGTQRSQRRLLSVPDIEMLLENSEIHVDVEWW